MMKNTAYDFNTCMHVPVAQCVELCNVNYLHLYFPLLHRIEKNADNSYTLDTTYIILCKRTYSLRVSLN